MVEGVESMKGRVLKKLKSISTITSLKQGLVFRTTNFSDRYFQTPTSSKDQSQKDSKSGPVGCSKKESEIIKDDDDDDDDDDDEEQEQGPGLCQNNVKDDDDVRLCSKLQPEKGGKLNCPGDADNVGVVIPVGPDQIQSLSGSKTTEHPVDCSVDAGESADLQPPNVKKDTDGKDSEVVLSVTLWEGFEEKCPPGGNESVVLYTTSMRGIRKTFEDCNSIRFLLESFRVQYKERDVSLDLEYRDELWRIMGRRAVPPRLFIRGRYIGGADEVIGLNETGMLKKLLQGIPLTSPSDSACKGCAGVRFVLCFTCNGSRKIVAREGQRGCDHEPPVARCSDCNENGLVKCPICNVNK